MVAPRPDIGAREQEIQKPGPGTIVPQEADAVQAIVTYQGLLAHAAAVLITHHLAVMEREQGGQAPRPFFMRPFGEGQAQDQDLA